MGQEVTGSLVYRRLKPGSLSPWTVFKCPPWGGGPLSNFTPASPGLTDQPFNAPEAFQGGQMGTVPAAALPEAWGAPSLPVLRLLLACILLPGVPAAPRSPCILQGH